MPSFEAIVLAGGRASRLGGADKPALVVGTMTLAAWVVRSAVDVGARRVIVVGPDRPELRVPALMPSGGLEFVREEPPGSGPIAALRCGLRPVSSPLVLVLAADLPFLRPRHLRELLFAAVGMDRSGGIPGRAGAIMLDGAGRQQWLVGCWQADVLRDAALAYTGYSLHGLMGPLKPVKLHYDLLSEEPPPWLDCDTPDDVNRARAWQEHVKHQQSEPRERPGEPHSARPQDSAQDSEQQKESAR